MCGIITYIGNKNVKDILLTGLKKMEYRGYDSAGVLMVNPEDKVFILERSIGKISELEDKLKDISVSNKFTMGIAHTRWATHGGVTEANAHPHFDQTKTFFLTHNGIIENYKEIKTSLQQKGYIFSSETDSEVLCQLIAHCYEGDLIDAVKKALSLTEGAYGIAVVNINKPNEIVVARNGSPLAIGIGKNEIYAASDPNALAMYTQQVVFLDDQQIALIKQDDFQITSLKTNKTVNKKIEEISVELSNIGKGNFPHFMLKEIFEQTTSLANVYKTKLDFDKKTIRISGMFLNSKSLKKLQKVNFLACGSSWHVAMIGKYYMERLARIPAEYEYASEYRYRHPVIQPEKNLYVAISQSGETADTLASIALIKEQGGDIFGITNVVGSSIARETKGGMFIHAGHEDGVAATKTFTSQIMAVLLLSLYTGIHNGNLNPQLYTEILNDIQTLPEKIESILNQADSIKIIAEKYADADNALFLGRDILFPIALEGALKLKEISYIHAEGYPAAELKHGPLALIDDKIPSFIIATQNPLYKKTISNIQEIRARNGKTIIIATEGDKEIESYAEDVIYIPQINEYLQPLLATIPMQLISYYIATKRGINVDRPRNLAKSVTVE